MVKRFFTKKYILLICIFSLIIFLSLYFHTKELFEEQPSKKYFALILRGESFRKGGQVSRNHGNEDTYEEQKQACETHMQLVRKIEKLGYNVDIFIDIYSTKYDEELKKWYGGNLKQSKFHTQHLENQGKLIEDSVQLMKSAGIDYSSLLILRVDLFLKPKFIEEYKPDIQTIQFICIMWSKYQKTPKGNPKVNDVIYHYPKQMFHKLPILYSTGHDGHDFLDIEKLEYEKEFSVLTRNFHDSDSAKDFNPYYRMTGREESKVWFDEGKVFPRDFK